MGIARKVEIFKVVMLTYASLAFLGVMISGIVIRGEFSKWFFDVPFQYRQLFYTAFANERNLSLILLFVVPVLMVGMVSFTQQELYESPALVDVLIVSFGVFAISSSVRIALVFRKLFVFTEMFASAGEKVLSMSYYRVLSQMESLHAVAVIMDVLWIVSLTLFVVVTLSRIVGRIKHI